MIHHISDYIRAQGWEWVPHGYKPPNNPNITVYPGSEKLAVVHCSTDPTVPLAPTYHIYYADPTFFDQLQDLNKIPT